MKNIMKKGVCFFVASLLACSAFADTQQAPAADQQQVAAASNTAAPAVPAAPQATTKHAKKAKKTKKHKHSAAKAQEDASADQQQG